MATALDAPSTPSIRRELAIDAIFVALIGLLCASFFWRLVGPNESERMYIAGGDFVNQFFPYQQFVASELREGRIPLWNPYILAGHPALADTQMAISYPVGLLLNYLFGLDHLTIEEVQFRLVLDYWLAGVFTFLFVKQITGRRIAGLLSGIAFSFSGYLMSYPGQQAPILESALWLPLVLLFLHRGLASHAWLPNVCLAGAAQALALLAGHPQTAMFLFYTASCYVAWLVNRHGLAVRKTLVVAVVFVSVALTLAAVQLLPVLEFLPLSTRMSVSYEDAAHGFEFSSVLGIVLPDWRNERSLYIGIAPLFLALWAVFRGLAGAKFWAGAAGISLLLSFGGRNPLFPILYSAAPGFSLFKDQERIALVFTFALAALAGLGLAGVISAWESLSVRGTLRSIAFPAALLTLASAAPFFTAEWMASSSFEAGLYGGTLSGHQLLLVFVALAAVMTGCMISAFSQQHWRRTLGPSLAVALIAFTVFDLFLLNWSNNIVPDSTSVSSDALTTMDRLRAESGTFRIRIENDEVLPSNYPATFGLDHIGGDTPIRVARVQQLLDRIGEWRLWQIFNVQYVVTRRSFTDGVELTFTNESLNTYRITYGLPRAYAVTDYIVAKDPAEALDLTLSGSHHPGDAAILEESPSFVQTHPGARRPEVELIEHSAQRIKIRSSGDIDAMLIVADTYYPGWRATVDGVSSTIYRADYALRAIQLPAGEHLVEMVFDPMSYRLGAAISIAGLLSVIAINAKARGGTPRETIREQIPEPARRAM